MRRLYSWPTAAVPVHHWSDRRLQKQTKKKWSSRGCCLFSSSSSRLYFANKLRVCFCNFLSTPLKMMRRWWLQTGLLPIPLYALLVFFFCQISGPILGKPNKPSVISSISSSPIFPRLVFVYFGVKGRQGQLEKFFSYLCRHLLVVVLWKKSIACVGYY